ncbi:MAG: hypothetical protein IH608_10105 [Proteobacteria bacterium]|nr:hypothetical protein [Pseudomonadota bacterium]
MKTTERICATLFTTLTPVTALAAASGREDTSGLFVWAFLGLCALIVAAQVVPAILMAVGAIKGAAEGLKERRAVAAESVRHT